MENLKNPENTEEILKQILEMKTYEEFKNIIDKTFPSWIIDSCDNYSIDYPHLNSNWKKICQMQNVNSKKIVLVKYLIFNDPEYSLLSSICEIMTRFGYCVRRISEFTKCVKCENAIPSIDIWTHLNTNCKNFTIPKKWSDKCENC
jgi:hypothetical protein